ncbi:MAG: RecB family exonuclease, partial [Gemmobacter sp.]
IDYKTGSPPTKAQQTHFDKQLLLEAAIARAGGFDPPGPAEVAAVTYVGLGSPPKAETIAIDEDTLDTVLRDLHALIARYQTRRQGFAARRAVEDTRYPGDYDHLARLGEWSPADPPVPEDVGPPDHGGPG